MDPGRKWVTKAWKPQERRGGQKDGRKEERKVNERRRREGRGQGGKGAKDVSMASRGQANTHPQPQPQPHNDDDNHDDNASAQEHRSNHDSNHDSSHRGQNTESQNLINPVADHPKNGNDDSNRCSRSSSSADLAIRPSGAHAGETKRLCTVCLESYTDGDKIRILPCHHRFHMSCIDLWLSNKRFCPLCKHDASLPIGAPHATEDEQEALAAAAAAVFSFVTIVAVRDPGYEPEDAPNTAGTSRTTAWFLSAVRLSAKWLVTELFTEPILDLTEC
mmetsp:Transcript_24866/g.44915  ORF Transcript_24866/g.44915 Transcript_24866/m.44915 type:complete len:276 (-) Transcript_24866:501-1328(-)